MTDTDKTAPTENTGDEGLRLALEKVYEEWADFDFELARKSWGKTGADMLLDEIMALIRQDRRELLERLKADIPKRVPNSYVIKDKTPWSLGWNDAINESRKPIDAELQHGA